MARIFDRNEGIVYSKSILLIGLISDTHIKSSREVLPARIAEVFRGVSLILHAGDIYIPSVLGELGRIAPVLAARGDDDTIVNMGGDGRIKGRHTINIEGVNLWLVHVKPYNWFLEEDAQSSSDEDIIVKPHFLRFDRAEEAHTFRPAREERPDVIVYGHSHADKIEYRKDILLVNPGSATLPFYEPRPGSVGLLNIDSGKVDARIIQLE